MTQQDIILAVTDVTGITFESMSKRNEQNKLSRKREIVEARKWVYYFSRRELNLSFKAIGKTFGGQDHSTVMWARTTIDDMMTYDKRLRRQFKEIKGVLALHTAPQEKDFAPESLSLLTLENELQKGLRAV